MVPLLIGNNVFGRALQWLFGGGRVRLKDIAAACLMSQKEHPDGTPGEILQDTALRYLAARYKGAGEARLRALIDQFVEDAKDVAVP